MKKIIEQAEIAFLDVAINFMSRENTPRIYSHTLAQMTLYLRPANHDILFRQHKNISTIQPHQWLRLGVIALIGLAIGFLLGWLRAY